MRYPSCDNILANHSLAIKTQSTPPMIVQIVGGGVLDLLSAATSGTPPEALVPWLGAGAGRVDGRSAQISNVLHQRDTSKANDQVHESSFVHAFARIGKHSLRPFPTRHEMLCCPSESSSDCDSSKRSRQAWTQRMEASRLSSTW